MRTDHLHELGLEFEIELLTGPHPDPLTYFAVEHFRQVKVTELLDEIVDDIAGDQAANCAIDVLTYLTDRLPLQEADEEADLIPLLLLRSADESGMGQMAEDLQLRRTERNDLVMELSSDLAALASGVIPGVPLNFIVRALKFNEAIRRDVAWENCALIPHAHQRLSVADLRTLGAAMARRRGLTRWQPDCERRGRRQLPPLRLAGGPRDPARHGAGLAERRVSFHEVQFPSNISRGARGGTSFKTTVVVTAGGHEQRNADWQTARGRWDVGHNVKGPADLGALIAFFRARRGRAYGFRFKDWLDFKSTGDMQTAISSTDQVIGIGDGTTKTFQLVKTYISGGITYIRQIKKPVAGIVRVALGGTKQASGWTVDTKTGIVTFTVAPAAGVQASAGYEFDVPARFDTDQMGARCDTVNNRSWRAIPIVEVRV